MILRAPRRFTAAFLALAIWLLPVVAAHAYQLEERVVEHTLGNGLKIIILPRHQSPVVSLYMTFLVGAADEEAGRSGTAHMLEHLMFKGTKRLGTTDYAAEAPVLARIDEAAARLDALVSAREEKGQGATEDPRIEQQRKELEALEAEAEKYVVKDEIDNLYNRNGAEDFNAYTSADMTVYHVDLPANRLELWASIEADRMQNPVLREFYSERDVVMEERRQSIESQPDRLLMELFGAAGFLAHPYRRPVIGWPSDVMRLPRRETAEFFRRFYAPDNTIVAVVGDVEPPAVIELLEKSFGPIPPSGVRRTPITREPEQAGERRVYLEAESNPSIIMGWHKPTLPHRDDYVLDVVEGILSHGRTSRLYRRLVETERAAVRVGAVNGYPGARYDNLFMITSAPLATRTPEEIEKLVYEEIDRLKAEPVTAEELEKIRTQMKADFVRGLQSNGGLANTLSHFQAVAGDWRYITRYDAVLDSITPEEIMTAVRKYFTPENRTVAILRKKP
jgi:predicted Zn-dependent peptidase